MEQPYDFYIVSDPNVPYESDPLRFIEQEEERKKFHQSLLEHLNKVHSIFEQLSIYC
jgi:nicotinamide riboside kinase